MMHIRNEDSRHTNSARRPCSSSTSITSRMSAVSSSNPGTRRASRKRALPTTSFRIPTPRSGYGVLRGMHYQDMTAPMAKLVRCTVGRILDVAVDLRMSSPTFGKWFSIELTAENKTLLYVPVGFAHGFATLSDHCEVQYKQTGFYNPTAEGGIAWNDPEVAYPVAVSESDSVSAKIKGSRVSRNIGRSRRFDSPRFIARLSSRGRRQRRGCGRPEFPRTCGALRSFSRNRGIASKPVASQLPESAFRDSRSVLEVDPG